ncbi:unnamed protein product [Polarella glacialis]|uniref:Uncharacterized protein n=1 Tax=Polarella glacialis TaxID=89957 RepID=A0A813ETP5_POLGL|nr:unnamed protein product [Polarella glacialis]
MGIGDLGSNYLFKNLELQCQFRVKCPIRSHATLERQTSLSSAFDARRRPQLLLLYLLEYLSRVPWRQPLEMIRVAPTAACKAPGGWISTRSEPSRQDRARAAVI